MVAVKPIELFSERIIVGREPAAGEEICYLEMLLRRIVASSRRTYRNMSVIGEKTLRCRSTIKRAILRCATKR